MKQAYNISSINAQDLDNPVNVFEDLIAHHSPMAHYLLNWISKPEGDGEWRAKLAHDIELIDGTIIEYCYPSDNGWLRLADKDHASVDDAQVKRVRLSKRQPLMNEPWAFRGEAGALDKPDYTTSAE